ncbi:hypothetical protein BDU57DRAFT_511646 [Ampelomyces quisqualis]|uniref:Uncharacterized protein n=1 Tax=Ampelomyces quisqualis TaxID=50730 RepID=A0A6A5QVG1_AMPQU|nr:hypothetical protein BDU57DRAFT_511646 [Ampelomyces quisqualis]
MRHAAAAGLPTNHTAAGMKPEQQIHGHGSRVGGSAVPSDCAPTPSLSPELALSIEPHISTRRSALAPQQAPASSTPREENCAHRHLAANCDLQHTCPRTLAAQHETRDTGNIPFGPSHGIWTSKTALSGVIQQSGQGRQPAAVLRPHLDSITMRRQAAWVQISRSSLLCTHCCWCKSLCGEDIASVLYLGSRTEYSSHDVRVFNTMYTKHSVNRVWPTQVVSGKFACLGVGRYTKVCDCTP